MPDGDSVAAAEQQGEADRAYDKARAGDGSLRKLAKDHPIAVWGGLAVGIVGLVIAVAQAKKNSASSSSSSPSLMPIAGSTGLDPNQMDTASLQSGLDNGFGQLENQQSQLFQQLLQQLQSQNSQSGATGPAQPPPPTPPPTGPTGPKGPPQASPPGMTPTGPAGPPSQPPNPYQVTLGSSPAIAFATGPSGLMGPPGPAGPPGPDGQPTMYHKHPMPPQPIGSGGGPGQAGGGAGGPALTMHKTNPANLVYGEEVLHVGN